ncbi:hypothetical protein ACJ73_08927 [Blastomyces percursus]|uniref:Uncharacterized protein n=1 Tax=Blastomyces percursus TaxID=1658174 RepID=A0A1J9PHN4_9EURO|nr:hypothetical protein ACJ73_08927 [Blastomyces percursus]
MIRALTQENDTGTGTESSVESAESGSTGDMSADNDISELDRFIEDVTDDEYDAGPEETGAIVWRHIGFHIIGSPVAGRPSILLAKVTLLHTKGNHSSSSTIRSRSWTFWATFSMAIDDEIFAPEFEKLKDIY